MATETKHAIRIGGYAPIREYAVIGDGRTCALVARDGSIDWLCLPNIDSPSTFARLLDADNGGSFRLGPDEPFEAERRYVDGTNVLETTFRTASGAVRVTDAMALTDLSCITPMREVIRRAYGIDGRVPMRWTLEPRFLYATCEPEFGRRHGRLFYSARRDALSLSLWDAGEAERADDRGATGRFDVGAGETALFSLAGAY